MNMRRGTLAETSERARGSGNWRNPPSAPDLGLLICMVLRRVLLRRR
jgi:hypothetical protein